MSVVFVPLPGTFRVELIFSQNGQLIENVYHVLSGGALLTADALRIAGKFTTWWVGSMRDKTTSTCSLQRIEVVDASAPSGVGIIYTTGMPVTGSAPASLLPNNVTVAVKWTTGLSGRSYRGRTFHCGLYPNAVSGNQLPPGEATAIRNGYFALIAALQGGSPSDILVVGSKRHANAWRVTGVITPIIDAVVEINLDSQRRRLTGPGRGI